MKEILPYCRDLSDSGYTVVRGYVVDIEPDFCSGLACIICDRPEREPEQHCDVKYCVVLERAHKHADDHVLYVHKVCLESRYDDEFRARATKDQVLMLQFLRWHVLRREGREDWSWRVIEHPSEPESACQICRRAADSTRFIEFRCRDQASPRELLCWRAHLHCTPRHPADPPAGLCP